MFSSFMPQPLSIPLQQMEPVSDQNSSVLTNFTGTTGPLSTNSSSHFEASNQQTASDLVSENQLIPNRNSGETGPMWRNVGLQKPLLPIKRKAAAESLSSDSVPEQLSVPNKRVVQMEANVNSPRSPASALNKKNLQFQSPTGSQGSVGLSNKRMTRSESVSGKTGSPRVQPPKSKSAAPEVSPKVQNGSSEAVRSKMRETLASALSVGNQNKEAPNEDKSAPPEEGNASMQADVESQPASTAPIENLELVGKSDGQKPQYNYVMPETDGSFGDMFFAKDELLQGNGLSWAWDMDVTELKVVETDVKPNLVPMDVGGYGNEQDRCDESGNEIKQVISSPQELAFKIEAELFKLFGGVNKKYKEKGRSLMFNLKDPNNPDLREKVLSAKISPERLCSMTPEELASKELSEWRMAKAEELDKMIVLPDSDVDVRRLVKKTHKGEYQVEVEQDDGVSVEVSVGSSTLSHFRPKKKTDNLSEKAVSEDKKSASEKTDITSGLTVSTDGTDIMQELIVDEFKDEAFLPPIVSLDEFIESLNSEPPFENLPVDAKETKTLPDNDDSETCGETGNEKASSAPTSASPIKVEVQTNDKVSINPMEERKPLSFSKSIGECLWEGDLQLTLASAVPVIGLFRSGEKTSTKEWPGSIEIKGRVRLQAFEKFLQELPMSRSRAVMVVHFALKDASSKFHQSSLSEAVDSYVAEERIGFGEPCSGVEVYFCPPHKRTTEMLCRLLSKDQTDILKTTDDGLIGVVVWRRAHPNSAMVPRRRENINANMKNESKSLHFGHGQPHTDRRLPPQPNQGSGGDGDDDDDIPPGFGPGVVARDVDDLPEFSFSGGSNSSWQTIPAQMGSGSGSGSRSRMAQPNPPRPVEHMRQLVYKYGQTGNNSGFSGPNWNGNEEDDDIPEWKPQHQIRQHPEVSVNNSVQELSMSRLANPVRPVMGPNVVPAMPIQQPFNLMQNGWAQPLPHQGVPPNAAIPGQHYGGGRWRPDDPRARGF